MARRAGRTGATKLDDADEASCQCATWVNAALVAQRGRCLIACGAPIERKHVMCRPCSLGNHTGLVCARYVPEYPKHLVRTCKRCGFDSALHQEEMA